MRSGVIWWTLWFMKWWDMVDSVVHKEWRDMVDSVVHEEWRDMVDSGS